MKKYLLTLIAVCILILGCGTVALAVDNSQSYLFDLSVDGGSNATVQAGDIVTVTLTLSRTDTDDDYQMYAVQDEIAFDSDYFSYVGNSLDISADGFTGSLREQSDGSTVILMNAYSGASDGTSLDNELVIGSFKLKALKNGTASVSNTDYKVSVDSGMDVYKSAASDLKIKIGTTPSEDDPQDDDEKDDDKDIDDSGTASRFVDVPDDHWANNYVEYLAQKNVVNGKTAWHFAPNDAVTRGEFVTMLARLSGAVLPPYGNQFSDVNGNAYYANAVAWALSVGVTNGTSAGTFSPDKLVTRQEIAAMIQRYASAQAVTLSSDAALRSFSDQAQIHSYAVAPVAAMVQAGIISGYPDGSFRPLGNATRAEAAKMLALVGGYED